MTDLAPPVDAPPSPERTAGDRYQAIRRSIAAHAPLSLADDLQARTLFVLMDILALAQDQAELLAEVRDELAEMRRWRAK